VLLDIERLFFDKILNFTTLFYFSSTSCTVHCDCGLSSFSSVVIHISKICIKATTE